MRYSKYINILQSVRVEIQYDTFHDMFMILCTFMY